MTILMSDPRVTRIPVREIDEPTVDLVDLAPTATGLSRLVHRGVLDRLRAADRALPAGVDLRVVEGCRSSTDQPAMLVAALEPAGLANYPTEWWHWSFGDRYWAHVTRATHALYGPLPMVDAA